VLEDWTQPAGIHIRRVRTPLGVIGVSHNHLILLAGCRALCRPGNAVFTRWFGRRPTAIHGALQSGLLSAGLPADAIQLVTNRDRAAVRREMLTMTDTIDVVVPRGSSWCNAKPFLCLPILREHCAHYIDKDADAEARACGFERKDSAHRNLRCGGMLLMVHGRGRLVRVNGRRVFRGFRG
jgi:glutamate-5-semialdehyde dehydrogenase